MRNVHARDERLKLQRRNWAKTAIVKRSKISHNTNVFSRPRLNTRVRAFRGKTDDNNSSLAFGRTSAGIVWCFFGGGLYNQVFELTHVSGSGLF